MLAFLHVPLRAWAEEHHGCSQGCGGGKGLNGSACSGEQLAAGWSLDWESSSALPWSQGEPWWHDHGGALRAAVGANCPAVSHLAKRRWKERLSHCFPPSGSG